MLHVLDFSAYESSFPVFTAETCRSQAIVPYSQKPAKRLARRKLVACATTCRPRPSPVSPSVRSPRKNWLGSLWRANQPRTPRALLLTPDSRKLFPTRLKPHSVAMRLTPTQGRSMYRKAAKPLVQEKLIQAWPRTG